MDGPPSAVLDLRDLFSTPWDGTGTLWLPWWLRWVPQERAFSFRSEILEPGVEAWDVLDTMTFPNGSTWPRMMHCRVIADGRLQLSADDMPGGAEITPRHDGFEFSRYLISAPVIGPIRVRLRCRDRVTMSADGNMTDRIELRFLGIRVGLMEMCLARDS
jgi:hypothetical protein